VRHALHTALSIVRNLHHEVIGRDKDTGEYVFFDCSEESPQAAEAFASTVPR
jgi:hypothetical protein